MLGIALMALVGVLLTETFHFNAENIALVPRAILDATLGLVAGAIPTLEGTQGLPGMGTRDLSSADGPLQLGTSDWLGLFATIFDSIAITLEAWLIDVTGDRSGWLGTAVAMVIGFTAVGFSLFIVSG